MAGKRRENGKATRFKSGNPGGPGRPVGSKSLSARILAETRNGDELVEIMASIARNSEARDSDRINAVSWLADRGFGKVVQPVDGDGAGGAIVVRWGATERAERDAGG